MIRAPQLAGSRRIKDPTNLPTRRYFSKGRRRRSKRKWQCQQPKSIAFRAVVMQEKWKGAWGFIHFLNLPKYMSHLNHGVQYGNCFNMFVATGLDVLTPLSRGINKMIDWHRSWISWYRSSCNLLCKTPRCIRPMQFSSILSSENMPKRFPACNNNGIANMTSHVEQFYDRNDEQMYMGLILNWSYTCVYIYIYD